jgi:hypothetical protein
LKKFSGFNTWVVTAQERTINQNRNAIHIKLFGVDHYLFKLVMRRTVCKLKANPALGKHQRLVTDFVVWDSTSINLGIQ